MPSLGNLNFQPRVSQRAPNEFPTPCEQKGSSFRGTYILRDNHRFAMHAHAQCLVKKGPLGRFHTRHSCKRARLWRVTIISTCLMISHTMWWWWGQVEEFRV